MTQGIALSVVIPIYNEQEILRGATETLADHFDRIIGPDQWQFVLVNNGSTDRSGEIIKEVVGRWPTSISVFEKTPNYGLALRAGLGVVEALWIHIVDIEQWDIPFLAWAWRNREQYDLFIGSKRADPTLNSQHRIRRLLSWGLNALLQLFFEYTGTETHGPKLINRKALQPVLDRCVMDRGQYDTEIVLRAVRAGLRIIEVPIPYKEHRSSRHVIAKKVIWNMIALNRMRRVIRKVPYTGPVRIHRVNREDILKDSAGGAR